MDRKQKAWEAVSELAPVSSVALRTLLVAVLTLPLLSGCDSEPDPCGNGTSPECVPTPPNPAALGRSWRVAFSEEFEGADYDHGKLTPCFDWNYDGACTSSFNNGKETYRPEQVQVSDGTAILTAEPLATPEPNDACFQGICTYKAGLLSTARPDAESGQYLFSFTYGYVESRMKFPGEPGFFTAFWMVPADPSYNYRSEIDIMEVLGGQPETIHMTYSYNGRTESYSVNAGPEDNGACGVRDYSGEWVRYGVDWQPDYIAWYINGVECGRFVDSGRIENEPMQLILHMMVDNDWERDADSLLTDQTRVGRLEVDYIRVYQQQ
ncbi:glycoside hydrolase family 16 protein [Rhodococcus sp. NPDC003383]